MHLLFLSKLQLHLQLISPLVNVSMALDTTAGLRVQDEAGAGQGQGAAAVMAGWLRAGERRQHHQAYLFPVRCTAAGQQCANCCGQPPPVERPSSHRWRGSPADRRAYHFSRRLVHPAGVRGRSQEPLLQASRFQEHC